MIKDVEVAILGDTVGEFDETFTLNLSAPQDAVITDGLATGTIINDDTSLAVNDASIEEGKPDEKPTLMFTVTRSGGVSSVSSVTVATNDGTALAGSDYVGIPPTTLTFSPGQATRTVKVAIQGDGDGEPNETFTLQLSAASGATIIDGVGLGTILTDD